MSLSDDIAAAESRAREAVIGPPPPLYPNVFTRSLDEIEAALDRYAAVCKLAGRAQGYLTPDEKNDIREALAALMEGCP